MTQKDEIILIPEGEYELMYECHETSYYIGGDAKVAVWFQIVDHSEYYGTSLARHYNAKKLIGKPAVGGAFTVGMGSDCAHEFAWVTNQLINPARVTLEEFTNIVVLGEIKTVTKTSKKKERHPLMHYSKINAILKASNS